MGTESAESEVYPGYKSQTFRVSLQRPAFRECRWQACQDCPEQSTCRAPRRRASAKVADGWVQALRKPLLHSQPARFVFAPESRAAEAIFPAVSLLEHKNGGSRPAAQMKLPHQRPSLPNFQSLTPSVCSKSE